MYVSAFSLNLSNSVGRIAPVAALLLTCGCAAPNSALLPDIDAWETRTLVLAALDDWQFHGRIAVRSEIDGFNGKLRWTQEQNEFSATASGPLGAGAIRIEGDNASVVLTDKDGIRTILEDAEAEVGFSLRTTAVTTAQLSRIDFVLVLVFTRDDTTSDDLADLEETPVVVPVETVPETPSTTEVP